MTSGAVLKIAASALALGSVLVSYGPEFATGGVAVAAAPKALKQAAQAAAKAQKALAARDLVKAIAEAETAVSLSPRDPALRMLLGQTYLAAGRFVSGEAAFAQVMTLEPGNSRAALSLALSQIALGQPQMALASLDKVEIDVADRGLAHALAGDLDGAAALLEPAARGEGASSKTRQNLALTYALMGRWTEARAVAAQDVSPDRLDRTLAGWAAFAQPQHSWDQVAALLGVKPVYDRGQPARLALAPAPAAAPVEVAAVEQVVEPVAAPEVVVAVAEAAPVEAAPAPTPVAPVAQIAFAPRSPVVQAIPAALIQAEPAPAKVAIKAAPRIAGASAAKPVKIDIAAPAPVKDGRFVVQLAAHDSAAMAEWAWGKAIKRHPLLARYAPTGETHGAFHRVAAGGFATHRDAVSVCQQVKASGGRCFVRAATGQAPAQWAVKAGAKRIAAR